MRALRALFLALLVVAQTGCAGSIKTWIVGTRDRQGDVALQRGNLPDASLAYNLALQVAPRDPHARAGAVTVQVALAQANYRAGRLENANESLLAAEKIDPKDPRVVDLREQLEQARLKRQIVISNYPTYAENGAQIRRSYEQLRTLNTAIVKSLQRFSYSYDTQELSKAIRDSYDLNAELTKNTNRLVNFRQVVESGVPDAAKATENLAPPASLLPLP